MNTALAALIELTNALGRETAVSREHVRALILMLAPFAPHLGEELFSGLFAEEHRRHQSVARVAWPTYDETLTVDSEIEIPVTVNGKKRAVVTASTDATDDEIRAAALADPAVRRTLGDKIPERVIIARSRKVLINIVVRP
jgi:leucyl-tRNA synthetase